MLIQSADNKRVKLLSKLASSRSARKSAGLCFCEGDTLYKDALEYHADVKSVYFREGHEGPVPEGAEWNSLTSKLFDAVSQVDSPQNVIFLCSLDESGEKKAGPPILLDGVADPGNMGTIIRTAVAFGHPVVVGEGSADIYSPKVVRSAMGALFRADIRTVNLREEIPALQEKGIRVLAATLSEKSRLLGEEPVQNTAIVIGNEANGVSKEVCSLCDGEIIIPMRGGCESLNAAVAASIFMWEMAK